MSRQRKGLRVHAKLGWGALIPLIILPISLLVADLGCNPLDIPSPPGQQQRYSAEGYQFCFWNVENLFDDQDDGRRNFGDKTYVGWLANDRSMLKLKLDKLTEALLKMNGGKGPDMIAAVEIESVRAAQLLQQSLNARLTDSSLHYRNLIMKEMGSGRHIAPAILTRLPVQANKTKKIGSRQRILEGRIIVDGHPLVVIASHWTSRLRPENETNRIKYAKTIYGRFNAMYHANPAVDVMICGDFNDTPDDPSVRDYLHATSDAYAVQSGRQHPLLLDLFAGKDPNAGFGTYYYRSWQIFDHLVASPGLLDNTGWQVMPETVRTVNDLCRPGDSRRRPWRFGTPRERAPRGYSDHFPVTVRLKVN